MTHRSALRAAIFGALAFAGAAAAIPAFAQSDNDAPRIVVRLADINMDNREGAKIALGRIEQAAAAVCGDRPNIADLERFQRYVRCRQDAVGRAVASLDRPLLSELAPGAKPAVELLASR